MPASAAHHNVATAPPVRARSLLESRAGFLRHPSGTRSSSPSSLLSCWDPIFWWSFTHRQMADHGCAQRRHELATTPPRRRLRPPRLHVEGLNSAWSAAHEGTAKLLS